MRVLYETPAGYAIFRVHESVTDSHDGLNSLSDQLGDSEAAIKSLVKLEHFRAFSSSAEAVKAMSLIGCPEIITIPSFSDLFTQITPSFVPGEGLLVGDDVTAESIQSRFGISCLSADSNPAVSDVFRAIRSELNELLGPFHAAGTATVSSVAQVLVLLRMAAGGTDIAQQIDLEANTTYSNMREWYGWHFPELAALVEDPVTYTRIVRVFGYRNNYTLEKLQSVLTNPASPDLAARIMAAAQASSGSEIDQTDMKDIQDLAGQILTLLDQKQQFGSEFCIVLGDDPVDANPSSVGFLDTYLCSNNENPTV